MILLADFLAGKIYATSKSLWTVRIRKKEEISHKKSESSPWPNTEKRKIMENELLTYYRLKTGSNELFERIIIFFNGKSY